jgi:hypothetical protein
LAHLSVGLLGQRVRVGSAPTLLVFHFELARVRWQRPRGLVLRKINNPSALGIDPVNHYGVRAAFCGPLDFLSPSRGFRLVAAERGFSGTHPQRPRSPLRTESSQGGTQVQPARWSLGAGGRRPAGNTLLGRGGRCAASIVVVQCWSARNQAGSVAVTGAKNEKGRRADWGHPSVLLAVSPGKRTLRRPRSRTNVSASKDSAGVRAHEADGPQVCPQPLPHLAPNFRQPGASQSPAYTKRVKVEARSARKSLPGTRETSLH